VLRGERLEAAGGLLQLPLEPRPVPATGLVPRDDDVDEPLEEVLFLGLGGAPCVLERLVRGEVLAGAGQVQPAFKISRDRP
jgi:hypothetical protein